MLQFASTHRQAIDAYLTTLQTDTSCEAVLLLDQNGDLIASQGTINEQDVAHLGTLIAGTFASSREIARMMSHRDEVQVLFQQGERANTLFMLIKERWILVLILKTAQPLGAVKLRTRQTVLELGKVLDDMAKTARSHAMRTAVKKDIPWPRASGYAQRLAQLRVLLASDFASAGNQALSLLENYLEELARSFGYGEGPNNMGRYVAFLRAQNVLSSDMLKRAEVYTQARHYLNHSYGLQTSPALAEEVISYIAQLLRQAATTAARIMTSNIHSIAHDKPLSEARDLMLREGLGRLPVLQDGRRLVGLLTERDIVIAEAEASQLNKALEERTVQEALPIDSRLRVVTIGADARYETVVEVLRKQHVQALIVTQDGEEGRPLGIITHADLLYRS